MNRSVPTSQFRPGWALDLPRYGFYRNIYCIFWRRFQFSKLQGINFRSSDALNIQSLAAQSASSSSNQYSGNKHTLKISDEPCDFLQCYRKKFIAFTELEMINFLTSLKLCFQVNWVKTCQTGSIGFCLL